ncbi:unnamed protein product, partial [Hymenolepis diminuta]|uniref:HECT domain-containing protein n=1 Tax=Hymenolepis diminuta TaxID=6216 RepID=A0A0R3SLZ4_HYMDI
LQKLAFRLWWRSFTTEIFGDLEETFLDVEIDDFRGGGFFGTLDEFKESFVATDDIALYPR